MKESEQNVEIIKRNLFKVDRVMAEKKLASKIAKVKTSIATNANQKLIGDLKSRK